MLQNLNNPPSGCPNPEDLFAYIQGEDLSITPLAMDAHLSECARCARECSDLLAFTNQLVSSSQEQRLPTPGFTERLVEDWLSAFHSPFRRLGSAGSMALGFSAAAVILCFVLGNVQTPPTPGSPTAMGTLTRLDGSLDDASLSHL
jgi:hypothetical protein